MQKNNESKNNNINMSFQSFGRDQDNITSINSPKFINEGTQGNVYFPRTQGNINSSRREGSFAPTDKTNKPGLE